MELRRASDPGPAPGSAPDPAPVAVERLPGNGSSAWPVLGYAIAAVLAVVALLDGFQVLDLALLPGSALVAGVVFVVLQRPAVLVDAGTLHLRGMVSTMHIPLAAVERVAVGRFLAVFTGERRFVSPAVQRSMRAGVGLRRGDGSPGEGWGDGSGRDPRPETADAADLVERRLGQLAGDARARAGVSMLSDEQLALAGGVRRTWSTPALAVLAVPAAALCVAVVALV